MLLSFTTYIHPIITLQQETRDPTLPNSTTGALVVVWIETRVTWKRFFCTPSGGSWWKPCCSEHYAAGRWVPWHSVCINDIHFTRTHTCRYYIYTHNMFADLFRFSLQIVTSFIGHPILFLLESCCYWFPDWLQWVYCFLWKKWCYTNPEVDSN